MYKTGLVNKKIYEELSCASPPEIIAPLPIYLCTDRATGINGQVFHIAGGEIAFGWQEEKNSICKSEGVWTIKELAELVSKVVLKSCLSLTPVPPENRTS